MNSAAQTTQLLTMKEAGALLKVHHRTVRTWAKQGLLEEVRLGPHLVRVTAQSVRDLIEGGRAGDYYAPDGKGNR